MIGHSQSAYSGYKAPDFLFPLFSCRLPLSCSFTSFLALSASTSLTLAISSMNVSSTFPWLTLPYCSVILLKFPSCVIPPQLILVAPYVTIYSGILYLSFLISTFLSFLIVSDILNSLFLLFIVCLFPTFHFVGFFCSETLTLHDVFRKHCSLELLSNLFTHVRATLKNTQMFALVR